MSVFVIHLYEDPLAWAAGLAAAGIAAYAENSMVRRSWRGRPPLPATLLGMRFLLVGPALVALDRLHFGGQMIWVSVSFLAVVLALQAYAFARARWNTDDAGADTASARGIRIAAALLGPLVGNIVWLVAFVVLGNVGAGLLGRFGT